MIGHDAREIRTESTVLLALGAGCSQLPCDVTASKGTGAYADKSSCLCTMSYDYGHNTFLPVRRQRASI